MVKFILFFIVRTFSYKWLYRESMLQMLTRKDFKKLPGSTLPACSQQDPAVSESSTDRFAVT